MHRHPLPVPPPPDDLLHVTRLFDALREPLRVNLLLQLTLGEHTVTALVEALHLPQSTVSRHLAVLRHAHLVTSRRDGLHMHYRLADAHLVTLLQEAFSHAQHARLALPDHPVAEATPGSVH
ncbi:ArsR/SmtB family transcription factor [Deinococcus multiflagellatus]|uniref:ArsR/SmtB family transcription factor n=1 Tax=Deinococcus multiflagellatus TaxID=1656887 RepID=A0ABW1ZRP2_9DEIO|nr:metalloregulator ArsR/SmtB family transcription factor [Deinococcus multiflagellatus]MBZ9715426.1 metalloregulator ArsR/SmtB family transcription factor [Deinococcus multiflagellatus]